MMGKIFIFTQGLIMHMIRSYLGRHARTPIVNEKHSTLFSFDVPSMPENQSFTIVTSDLFKVYCLNKEFRKVIAKTAYGVNVNT